MLYDQMYGVLNFKCQMSRFCRHYKHVVFVSNGILKFPMAIKLNPKAEVLLVMNAVDCILSIPAYRVENC